MNENRRDIWPPQQATDTLSVGKTWSFTVSPLQSDGHQQ
jgi:hypothetical protein